ncbi:MAG TPA: hypothetical protein VK843_22335 [Planctomycetota bacterium]|nr:hypothetical protein [Planctomycetota bacterium]
MAQEENVRRLGEQSQRVLEDVRELGSTALASVGEVAGQWRERGAAAVGAGREKVSAAKGQFEDVIAENPLKSVLIALGVGAVIGCAFRRR